MSGTAVAVTLATVAVTGSATAAVTDPATAAVTGPATAAVVVAGPPLSGRPAATRVVGAMAAGAPDVIDAAVGFDSEAAASGAAVEAVPSPAGRAVVDSGR